LGGWRVSWVIHQGDVLERLREMPNESVNCVVTSPPYFGLRDYGCDGQIGLEPTPQEFIGKLAEVFRECRRVLTKDGTCWVNMGDSYGQSKQLLGIPWRLAFALQDDGWWLRQDIIWAKPNPMPESVTDRCTKAHEYIFLLTKSERYYFDAKAIQERATYPSDGIRVNTPKNAALGLKPTREYGHKNGDFRNPRSVWTITPKPYPGAHFAVFPPDIPRRCILAGCPPGGLVLDPFAGSGTTLAIAVSLGRRAIGVELNPEYVALIEERMSGVTPSLFMEGNNGA
jgi:DNA modification methylase